MHASLLLRLSCATALGQRSLAPLQPFFASCQDAVFVAALGVEDAMMAVDVVKDRLVVQSLHGPIVPEARGAKLNRPALRPITCRHRLRVLTRECER